MVHARSLFRFFLSSLWGSGRLFFSFWVLDRERGRLLSAG